MVGLGADGAINVEACLGVDALGRLVDQQGLGLVEETPRQNSLLLVAARKPADRLIEIRGDDIELFDQRKCGRAFLRRRDQPAGGELVEHLYRHVFAHAEAGKDRFRRPIGAERENAGVESVARPAGSDDPAVAQHLAFGVFKAAKRTQRFALPVAFGAGKADNLAAAHLEREIRETRSAQTLRRENDLGRRHVWVRRIFRVDRPPHHQ